MKTSKTPSLSWQNKLISTALASASLFLGAPQLALATVPSTAATNVQVTAGLATFATSGTSTLTVTVPGSTTSNTVLTWQNFSDNTSAGGLLAPSDTVSFNLPTSTSGILNNVVGNIATQLNGKINSNGNVFFLNPAGIIVANGASINVNNFYASTVTDTSATGYFANNGTLGVFNGVTQITGTSSGIIYVQSGAQINTTTGSGTIGLASAYGGSAISFTNYPIGNLGYSTSNTSVNWTLNNGVTSTAATNGINVESLTTSGNINIISQGYGAAVLLSQGGTATSTGITMNNGYVGNTGVLGGGNLNVTTNLGPIQVNGPIAAAGNISLSTTPTSTANSGATIGFGSGVSTANVAAQGTVSITGNANINFTQQITDRSGGGALNSVGAANINGGSAGNVTLFGDLASGTIIGNNVNLNNNNGTSRIYSNLTAYGTAIISTNASVTVTLAQIAGGLTATSNKGSVTIGSLTGATSTINGAASTITGYTGANLNNANVNVAGTAATALTIQTNNGVTAGAKANVNVTSVTLNGPLYTYATGPGDITLTTVNAVNATNVPQPIIVGTTNGSITLSSVTTSNGSITATANNYPNLANNAITLTNVVNSTPNKVSGAVDTFTTGNGNIAFNNYTNYATNVAATAGTQLLSTGSITSTSTQNFGGTVNLTACVGTISITGVSIAGVTPASTVVPTTNAVTLTTINTSILGNANNGKITFQSNTDANVTVVLPAIAPPPALATNNISSALSVSITSTGNLTIGNAITAPSISLIADSASGPIGNLTLGGAISSTANTNTSTSSITLQSAGNLSTLSQGVAGTAYGVTLGTSSSTSPQTVKLTSVTGNVNVDATTASYLGALTASAPLGNITLNVSNGLAFTTNSASLTAANGTISQINGSSLINTVGTTQSLQTLTANASTIMLGGANTLPSIKLLGGINGVTVNSSAVAVTTNIANGTNLLGSLTVNTAGPISIGASSTDTVSVAGFTILNTLNTIVGGQNNGTNGSITTSSDTAALLGGVSALTNGPANSSGGDITLGTTANAGNFAQISASTQGGTLTIYTGTAANLGSILAKTLNVNANGVTNTSGSVVVTGNANVFSGTPAVYGGAQQVPGSITLGNASSQAAITVLNVLAGNNLTLNATTSTLNAGVTSTSVYANQPISTLTLTDTSSGALTFISTSTGTAVGSVTGCANSGPLTYTVNNGTTGSGSLATSTGGINATGTGLGNVTFNLASSTGTSTITNLGSFTLNNVISSPTASGGLTVSANSGAAGASTLTLGTGINLQGSGRVIFSTGNDQITGVSLKDKVTDTATSAVTVNSSATTYFNGNTISLTNPLSSYGPVAFTSNGSVNFTNNGNVVLAGLTLGKTATGTSYITSTTGNISQTYPTAITSTTYSLSLTASATGNNGISLGLTNGAYATTGTLSLSASGNVAVVTNNDINLGNVSIVPSTNAGPTSSGLTLSSGYTNSTTGNISQASTSGVYVWGPTALSSSGGSNAKNGITLTNGAGNNFGAITVTATSVNANIIENATSSYAGVTAANWTAQSLKGDVATATVNTGFNITGNTSITATNGNISIVSTGSSNNQLEGAGNTIFVSTGGNATLVDSAVNTKLANASKVGGNLSVTNTYNGGTISDTAGSSGITVTGILSLLETGTSGYINFTGSNNTLGGLVTRAVTSATIFASGNLVLAPGSVVGSETINLTGNLTTSGVGGSSYTNLYITTNLGNVTIGNPTSISGSISITAPLGTVNLSALSSAVDLKGLTPIISAATYVPPSS